MGVEMRNAKPDYSRLEYLSLLVARVGFEKAGLEESSTCSLIITRRCIDTVR